MGPGLGLSVVHDIAAQSGGLLRIDSAPSMGTAAELWLPRSGFCGAGGGLGHLSPSASTSN